LSRIFSLRYRLLGALLAVFAVGLIAALASYRFAVHNLVADLRARSLQAQARAVIAALHVNGDGRVSLSLPPDWARAYGDPSQQFSYTLFDAAGAPLTSSANLSAPLPDMAATVGGGVGHVVLFGAAPHQQVVLTTAAPAGRWLTVARRDIASDTLVDSLFEEGSEHLLVLAPIALLALGLIWAIASWSLRPLERASREAALAGPGMPEARITRGGLPREIVPLVDAVNAALDRLARAYATERQLTADAAHELRTPLAVLALRLQRARLSGATDWPAIESDLAQMTRLVEQLLDLARKESLARHGAEADLGVVNLSRVVRQVAATLVPLMEARARRLEVEVPEVAAVRGRVHDLEDMLRNLLDNALLHGEGTVRVRIEPRTSAAGEQLMVEVSDEGGGVPPGEEESVFARFRRVQADAPGSGLGLAIVRQVARSHGGDVQFVAGRGCVVLLLPAAPSAETRTSVAAGAGAATDPDGEPTVISGASASR